MRTIRSNGLSETTCNIIIIIHQVSTLRTYPGFGGDAKAVLRNLYFAYLPDGTTRVSYNIGMV